MTEHIKCKHFLDKISGSDERLSLIALCALDDTDKEILRMRYVKFNDFGYIADTLGLAYPTIIKRHKKALCVFQALAAARVNSI